MNMVGEWTIPGLVKAQPRTRARFNGGGVYTPTNAKGWKDSIRIDILNNPPVAVVDCPVYLEIEFRLPRPKGHYGTGKNSDKVKESAPFFVTAKPDLDNLEKAVMDAITQTTKVWRDDSLVVSKKTVKIYSGDNPGCTIRVYKHNDNEDTLA